MKLLMSKQLNGQLKPCYDSDAELLKKIKAGDEVEVEIKRKRNLPFHKKLWALLNLVFSNQIIYTDIDDLRKDLTIASGYYRERSTYTGEMVLEPLSISFAKMDQDTFDDYYQKMLNSVCNHMGISEKDIQENIADYF
jgi:hypothetical protein